MRSEEEGRREEEVREGRRGKGVKVRQKEERK